MQANFGNFPTFPKQRKRQFLEIPQGQTPASISKNRIIVFYRFSYAENQALISLSDLPDSFQEQLIKAQIPSL
jgi:hypothetical protein